MKRTTRRGTTAAGLTLLALALAGCGGGGGGNGSSSGTNSSNGTGSTGTTTSNGAALLAAYTPPASIVADVQTAYSGPAFSTYNSGLASNCSTASKVSGTVIVTPNALVFSAGASLKAQELAADLLEQAIPQIRTALGLASTGVAFDGTNKIQVCVDASLGQSAGETGTSIVGQTGTGVGPVMQVMSADAASFDARYPGATSYTAPVGQSYADLFVHEGTHAAIYSLTEPFLGTPTFYQEGMATTISHLPLASKASILAAVQASDLLSTSNANTDMGAAYSAYEATIEYITSSASGGLGFPMTGMPAFLATFKAQAEAVCAQPIPNGLIPTAAQTVGLPAGQYNVCASGPGVVNPVLNTAFDAAWNATFKDTRGGPLYLHSADSPNSLESTLYQRLNGFL
ncbi:hypothetical protein [Burkholderia vietnamiensis]|uniref:hypothetical protein n=1 Tax=Burkholderia vietnamiensis TaxID=60552 RepID=UPI001CF23BF6|nr:hypothetical protein [Burkholderia vietnamiensis]MCA8148190.1 hypothetical protein [Burkholderia vietnamiensis]